MRFALRAAVLVVLVAVVVLAGGSGGVFGFVVLGLMIDGLVSEVSGRRECPRLVVACVIGLDQVGCCRFAV